MPFDDSAAWSDFWGSGKARKKAVIPVPASFKRTIPTPSNLRVNALRARMNALNKQRRQLLRLKRKQYVREAVNQRKAVRVFSNVLFGSRNIQAANERARAAGLRLQAEGLAGYGAKGAKAVGNKLSDFLEKNRGIYDRKLRNPFKREIVIFSETKEEYDKRKRESNGQ